MEKGKDDRISTIEFEDSVNVNIDQPPSVQNDPAPSSSPMQTKVEMSSKTCPVDGVTVFLDRAEVKRVIEVDLTKGESEILITELPEVMDEDSIRITCLGEAKIIEVSHKIKRGYHEIKNDPNPEGTEAKKKDLKEKKVQLERDIEQLHHTIGLLEKETKFLSSFGERLGPNDKASEKLAESFDKKSMESVAAFITFYHVQGQRLADELFQARTKVKTFLEDIEKIDKELEELEKLWGGSSHAYDEKQVLILLETEHDTNMSLILSYVVKNASWSPLYDLRAFSEDNSLQLLYFGKIKQSTGEDWNDAKFSLSTAKPSVGGAPPDLEMLHIHTIGHHRKNRRRASYSDDLREYCLAEYALMGAEDVKKSSGLRMSFRGAKAMKAPARSYIPTDVKEGMTSTTFEIARKSTIKSDDVGHKVSIGLIEFKPKFEYEAVPKLVAHAFFTAKVKNNSSYALLEGPANVFLDNNFLTKSYMNAVSPQEEFEVSLGVDPAVKITYKPLNKFEKKSGLVTKYKQIEYHQEIIIKNTKASKIKIKVSDQLPKSSEDKLKVTLVEPYIPVPKHKNEVIVNPAVKLTDKNHVEWTKEIEAYQTEELHLKYVVEFPANVDISIGY